MFFSPKTLSNMFLVIHGITLINNNLVKFIVKIVTINIVISSDYGYIHMYTSTITI